MWLKVSQIILRYRIVILIVLAAITGMFGYFAATNVKINTRFANMLPPEDPMRIEHEKLKEMFGQDGNVMVIGVEDVDLFKLENFRAWYKLGQELKKIEGIDSVFSVAHMYRLRADNVNEKFKLELITKRMPETQAEVDSIKDIVLNQVFYKDLIYKDNNRLSLMMVTVNAKRFNSLDRGSMIDDIYEKTQEYESQFPHLRYSGLPYIRDVVANSVKSELKVMIALAGLVLAVILYLFYRSIVVVIACLFVVFIGVIWSFGTIGLLDFRLTMIMGLIPPLIIVIGIPNCTYLLNKYHAEYIAHGNKIKALSRIIQKIGNATFMTNVTTALGFGTFIFTNSEKMQQFGIVAFINIIAVFFISICLIPIVFSFLNPPEDKHTKHLEKKWVEYSVNKLVRWVTNHRRWVYITTMVLIAVSLWGLSKIETTGNISSDLPKGNPVLADLRYFESEFGGVMPFEVVIDANGEGEVQKEQLVRRMERVQRQVEKYKFEGKRIFARSLGLVDAIKYVNQAFQGGDSSNYNIGIYDLSRSQQGKIQKYLEGPDVQKWKRMRTKLYFESTDSMKLVGLSQFIDSFPSKSSEISIDKLYKETDSSIVYESEELAKLAKPAYKTVDSTINAMLGSSKHLAKGFLDSTGRFTRVSFQVADIGSKDMDGVAKDVKISIDSILNPVKDSLNYYKQSFIAADGASRKSILNNFYNSEYIAKHCDRAEWQISRTYKEKLVESRMNELAKKGLAVSYNDKTYDLASERQKLQLETAIKVDIDKQLSEQDDEYSDEQLASSEFEFAFTSFINENIYDFFITGTSVVFAKGTTYLVDNLITSLMIAVGMIAVLMALLFSSIRMVLVSLLPNFIPLITTAGIMGWAGIPIKPSTVLVFSVAFGISIDDTIHYLAKYRQELKNQSWNIRGSVLNALKETGVSMIYTSIVLFFGFCVFATSSFGGTVALGVLVSITLLVAMLSNLVLLPSLLLWLDKSITNKAFKEPLLELIDEEEDIELSDLEIKKEDE